MKIGLGVLFLLVSCWVLFLQLSAQSYVLKTSEGLSLDGNSDPLRVLSDRATISVKTKKKVKQFPTSEHKGGANSSSTKTPTDICFVTSEYADDVSVVDQLSIPTLANRPGFRHFLFTNLPDLKPQGWTQVVTDLNFPNRIVESRYAKFLGWKFPEIADSCQIAIYIDGIYKTADKPDIFEKVANQILNKPSELPFDERPGWMQFPHNLKRDGPLGELLAIRKLKKDTEEHIKLTTDWLYSQVPSNVANATEWLATTPVYLNTWFAYNPTSPHFRRVTEDFWSVYSRGIITWRDQPIWAFYVRKHGKQPLPFPGRKKTYFKLLGKAGFGDHTYVP